MRAEHKSEIDEKQQNTVDMRKLDGNGERTQYMFLFTRYHFPHFCRPTAAPIMA